MPPGIQEPLILRGRAPWRGRAYTRGRRRSDVRGEREYYPALIRILIPRLKGGDGGAIAPSRNRPASPVHPTGPGPTQRTAARFDAARLPWWVLPPGAAPPPARVRRQANSDVPSPDAQTDERPSLGPSAPSPQRGEPRCRPCAERRLGSLEWWAPGLLPFPTTQSDERRRANQGPQEPAAAPAADRAVPEAAPASPSQEGGPDPAVLAEPAGRTTIRRSQASRPRVRPRAPVSRGCPAVPASMSRPGVPASTRRFPPFPPGSPGAIDRKPDSRADGCLTAAVPPC